MQRAPKRSLRAIPRQRNVRRVLQSVAAIFRSPQPLPALGWLRCVPFLPLCSNRGIRCAKSQSTVLVERHTSRCAAAPAAAATCPPPTGLPLCFCPFLPVQNGSPAPTSWADEVDEEHAAQQQQQQPPAAAADSDDDGAGHAASAATVAAAFDMAADEEPALQACINLGCSLALPPCCVLRLPPCLALCLPQARPPALSPGCRGPAAAAAARRRWTPRRSSCRASRCAGAARQQLGSLKGLQIMHCCCPRVASAIRKLRHATSPSAPPSFEMPSAGERGAPRGRPRPHCTGIRTKSRSQPVPLPRPPFEKTQVSEEPPVDDPDLSIKADHLVDDSPGEIKTVTADNTMYTSGGCCGCCCFGCRVGVVSC